MMPANFELLPPPGSLTLHKAWQAFFDRYWSSAPLPPRPDGLSLKVQDRHRQSIGAIFYNPTSGKYFVRTYSESPPDIDFRISVEIKHADDEIEETDVLSVNFSHYTSAEPILPRSGEAPIPTGQVSVPSGSRMRLVMSAAPKNFPCGTESRRNTCTPEQQKWANDKFDRTEEAGRAFAAAVLNGEFEVFVCQKTATSERRLDQLDPAAWGIEAPDDDDQSTSSSACLARYHLLGQEKITENVLPYLSDLCGMTPYVWKKQFDNWLNSSPRHKPPVPRKSDSDSRILDSHCRLFKALEFLKISWPPKGQVSTTLAAKKVCNAQKARKIEPIGWRERLIRDVLDGKHTPSNRLAAADRLPRWWFGEPWSGNLPKK
jgi:hypothetical protein